MELKKRETIRHLLYLIEPFTYIMFIRFSSNNMTMVLGLLDTVLLWFIKQSSFRRYGFSVVLQYSGSMWWLATTPLLFLTFRDNLTAVIHFIMYTKLGMTPKLIENDLEYPKRFHTVVYISIVYSYTISGIFMFSRSIQPLLELATTFYNYYYDEITN